MVRRAVRAARAPRRRQRGLLRARRAGRRRRPPADRLALHRAAQPRGADLVGYFSSGEDITVRRAIEQSVERTRSLLNEAQEIGNIGNFEVHVPDTGIEFWSPQLHRIFGLDPVDGAAEPRAYAVGRAPGGSRRGRPSTGRKQPSTAPGSYASEFRIVTPAGRAPRAQRSTTPVPAATAARTHRRHDPRRHRGQAGRGRRARDRAAAHDPRLAPRHHGRDGRRHRPRAEPAAGGDHELRQRRNSRLPVAGHESAAGQSKVEDVRTARHRSPAQALRAGEVIRRLRSLVQRRDTRREPADINQLVEEVISFSQSDARLHNVRLRAELGARAADPADRRHPDPAGSA
jgi:PAS domain-containing protein